MEVASVITVDFVINLHDCHRRKIGSVFRHFHWCNHHDHDHPTQTHICELIMMEKTLEKKGAGVHLDIVLLSLLNMGSGVVGGPWVCAATVSKANCLVCA